MALFPLRDDTPLKNVSFQYVTVTLIGLVLPFLAIAAVRAAGWRSA